MDLTPIKRPFLLAQVSDVHVKRRGEKLLGRIDTAPMLRACVAAILRLEQQPDAVALTGDLTDLGTAEEYTHLRELLAPLTMPLYVIPGNHDDRAALRAAFPDHDYLRQSPEFIQYAIDDYPLRIVAIDTVVPRASDGELCAERLGWLDRTLAAARDKPTVVLMHHPPFRTYIGHMDAFALRDPEPFAAIIERNTQVAAVLIGHVHRPVETRFAGTIASIAPSCAHQVALDLDSEAPSRYVMEPPAFRVHAYTPEGGVVSHTAYIGDFGGPQSFKQPK